MNLSMHFSISSWLCESTYSQSTCNKPLSENLWSFEGIGTKDPSLTESDDEAFEEFCKDI